ncbi:MAG TPA: LamG domain-containing protein [Candidatus Paceibacterota bacterium]|nr:LamG domain-containing protein [Verrucomicrobiota bacterium]HSA13027.1 LamG domain-containing protein [Candidatus Paceibacterota bacterium]
MPPNLRKLKRLGLAWALAAMGAWPSALLAADIGGHRVQFPTRPLPVYNTNTPNLWASTNLTSVPINAGGNTVVRTNDTGVRRYPYNVYDAASTNEPTGYQASHALPYSSFGHVVTGNRPDYFLGDQIAAPTEVLGTNWFINWAAMGQTNISPANAIYEPSVQQVYAIGGGQVTITWVFTDGASNTNITRTYLVSGTPSGRPFRVYWTEPPYGAPTINLQGRHVKFHWNNSITAPQTNSSGLVRGLMVDSSGQLHAAPGPDPNGNPLQGMVVMQYFKTGDLRDQVPGGVVVVEVRRPQVNTLKAGVSKRLLPEDSPYGDRGLVAHVTRGLDAPAYVYQHQGQYTHSPKNGWVYAIRPSTSAPWMIEVYWEEADPMGTLWPYEVDWYAAAWPGDAQPYVRGSTNSLGADVLTSMTLSPKLMDAQEPPGHAHLSAQGVFNSTSEGYSLLQFTANDNVWFQAVRSVYHTNQFSGADPLRWPVGAQLQPALSLEALRFNGGAGTATVTNFPGLPGEFTVECWFAVSNANNGKLKPLLSRSWGTNAWEFMLGVNGSGWLTAWMQTTNPAVATLFELKGVALENGQWCHAALSVSSNGATLFANGQACGSAGFETVALQNNASPLRIGWGTVVETNFFLKGQLDEIRLWSKALSPAEVALALSHSLAGDVLTNLLAYYPVESDGTNAMLLDLAGGGRHASFTNATFVQPGATPVGAAFSPDHGYVYDPPGRDDPPVRAPYNAALYRYPTVEEPNAETYIFGVNGGRLEVWWAQRVQQTDMPEPVYFPAWACAYSNVWAVNNAPEIVLASGKGSPAFQSGDTASIYAQNNISLPGYNPNEEHALMGQDQGGWVAYALRDDLNIPQSSPPFVLVNYTDPDTGHPLMRVFHVIRTNAQYPAFEYSAVVGDPLRGPRPLDLMLNAEPTTATTPWAWRDRNLTWWAVGSGPGETNTAVVMANYYPMQLGFWFPEASTQPAAGNPIPWLPDGATNPTNGTPQPVRWTLSWPTNVPEMKVGQTLTRAGEYLPEIWNQASVDIAFQQSAVVAGDPAAVSVRLFDPTVARDVEFLEPLSDYGFTSGPDGNTLSRQGMTYFQNLPPDLSDRFYYDPPRKKLRFIGRLMEPATGQSWLQVNRLSARQRDELKAICTVEAKTNDWCAAIDLFPTDVVEVAPNDSFDHLALGAVGRGAGYVTLAFNNSTNLSPGAPISLSVIKVLPELYTGFLIPLKDPLNLLSEQMNILFSESFAGDADLFEFQWVAVDPPTDGTVPSLPSGDPSLPFAQEDGLTRLRIGGMGATLQDLVNRFFTVRYRATTNSPALAVVGPDWSDYADFALAEGWVQRVMFSINPFEQRLRDLYSNPTETHVSMVQQAGRPYVGDVALNMEAVNDVGLIELYQTVLNRARRLSLDLGINSPAVNQQLLLAASRLHALYMMLGNDAFADALDPTIGFGSTTVINNGAVLPIDYGAFSSSLFCFANQVPTLLDEELALLRGRGTPTLAPGVGNYPYYNRLLWNFTRGLDAGEVAYAVNYNIHSSDNVTITADTAAGLYPQGHGDAYGHYLSALKGYYYLLRNPYFNWGDPSITSLLLDYQTISADYDDETRFAEASAALARTGLEVARRASRKAYTDSADSAYTSRLDTDPDRAWGVTEWIGRTGMGAFYNWAAAQSLLSTSKVDVAIEGNITSIDRSSVKSLREIVTQYAALQRELDQVDQGLNPLGLARGAVPFDISAADIDAGKTHFEQVYERAVGTLANAHTTFDAVQETVRLLRQQSESALQFEESVADQEMDYTHRLIEIFGYPYANDIGTNGTYAQGYDGPDLFHFMYMDLEALGFDKRTDIGTNTVSTNSLKASDLLEGGKFASVPLQSTNITFHLAANGLLIKPEEWSGDRRAEGEIQRAYRDCLVALLELRTAKTTYENKLQELKDRFDWYVQYNGWYDTMRDQRNNVTWLNSSSIAYTWLSAAARAISRGGEATVGLSTIPKTEFVSLMTGLAGASLWVGAGARGDLMDAMSETMQLLLETQIAQDTFHIQDQEMRMAIVDLARNQRESASALLVALQKASDAQAAFQSVVAEGERLLQERESFRTSASARIAASRYNDMAFRVFRNDALRRYSDAFELAARYTYLAAKAYDYETGLLPSDTTQAPGTQFMDRIVRARTLGRVVNGQPVLGVTGIGEPGLADILARMNANWGVLRGRLGFNNPETETGRFSLRTELFRILPGPVGDPLWRQKLEECRVDDLFALQEFRRSCLPFASQSGLEEREPGLVIPFTSTIDFAKNFFGRDLAGGDNAYDSSHFATKIRSVGIWFGNYDCVTDGSQGVYLANQPRVYLLPLGQDIMRSPTGLGDTLRQWQVLDQAIPLPFPIGPADLDNPDWIPIYDTLSDEWAQARRFPSMRAYHDHGFNVNEMVANSRLVGRSVWNTRWALIIPAGTLNNDRAHALDWFIGGATGTNGVSDIKLFFQTYSYAGN